MNGARSKSARQGGFTLIELTIVLGLLTGFLVMLTQIVSTGVGLFGEGATGQDFADRADLVGRRLRVDLRRLVGPATLDQPSLAEGGAAPAARFLVQRVPLGMPEPGRVDAASAPMTWVLRADVSLPEREERALWEPRLRDLAQLDVDEGLVDDFDERLAELRATLPLRGRGRAVYIVWPEVEPNDGAGVDPEPGAYLEIRRGLFLLEDVREALVAADLDDDIRPALIAGYDDFPALSAELVERATSTWVSGLLHAELQMWSQDTVSWTASGSGAPYQEWDSARAGLLFAAAEAAAEGAVGAEEFVDPFPLDLGPDSLRDLSDDVYPRGLRLLIVVGRDSTEVAPTVVIADAASDASSIRVASTDDLPDPERYEGSGGPEWIKVGSEWVQVNRFDGFNLSISKRGGRNTPARAHESGTSVRTGRTQEIVITVPFGRDANRG